MMLLEEKQLAEKKAAGNNERGTLHSVVDDTATNSTGNPNACGTALSVGLSPGGNLSLYRRGQRSEAFMLDHNAISGGVILNNYESRTPNQFSRTQNRFSAKPTRLVSTRKTGTSRSGMPKTAINYYNLRKGLYIKNGASRG